jgi:beta-N-acetylhexosaminidase
MNLAQLFIVGFDSRALAEGGWLAAALQRNPPGGVILFDRNVDGATQNFSSSAELKSLTRQLRELAAAPLLIAADQEGGKVRRLKERDGFPAFPSAEELGRCGPEQCAASAASMAALLADHGVNFNLAPVADLNLNPASPIIARYGRSFSHDPTCAADCCRAFIEAHRRCGVACCLKHFPGHGSAKGDTHLGFVDITEDWQEVELEPYRLLIRDGLADAVMTAHVVHRGLEPEGLPASLSPAVTALLRQRLGFGGLLITDDLQMKAVTAQHGYKEAVRRAVLAGADMLIVGNNLSRSPEALAEGVSAVQEVLDQGLITAERIRTSLARIAALHDKLKGERTW